MNLNTYFQISVSVFCNVATLAILVFVIFSFLLRAQVNKLMKQLMEISEIAKNTAGDSKAFVDRSIKSLESFRDSIFTFEFIRQIITQVVELISNNKKSSRRRK